MFAAGDPLECSWLENSSWATHQRLELETALIAAYVERTGRRLPRSSSRNLLGYRVLHPQRRLWGGTCIMARQCYFLPVVFSLLLPVAADAEPITLRFNVDVFIRCLEGAEIRCEDYFANFPLRVTFDSNVTDESESQRTYGRPRFSTVPLPRPAPPPDAPQGDGFTRQEILDQEQGYLASIFETTHLLLESPFSTLFWFTVLSQTVRDPTLPALSPESLIALLATADPQFGRNLISFQYGMSHVTDCCTGDRDLVYGGTATLLDVDDGPAPIPEPGTILLLSAAGIATVCRRRILRRCGLNRAGRDLL